jgi:hypothetical protein
MGAPARAAAVGSLLALFLCAGCSGPATYHVTVSSIAREPNPVQPGAAADTTAAHKTYVMRPGTPGVAPDDLQFLEFAVYVERVLASKGYVRTADEARASTAVSLCYDLDASRHTYTYSTPIYGPIGVCRHACKSGGVTHQTIYGVVGSQLHTGTFTTFHRSISIAGYDVRRHGDRTKDVPRWETTIRSSGSESDMRRLFPILIAAAIDRVATNTINPVDLTIAKDDPRIRWVKGLPPEPSQR